MADMKPIGQQAPYLPVVDTKGNIKHIYYSQNAGHAFVQIFKGQGVLNPAGLEQGYTELEKLYKEDPRPNVAAKGFRVYRDYDLACRRKTCKTQAVPGSVAGTTKQAPVPLLEQWLPLEVIARRNGTSTVSAAGWEPPALEEPEEVRLGGITDSVKAKRGDQPKKAKADDKPPAG